MTTLNVWGTAKELIDEDEFCPDCERENGLFGPRHYTNCPQYKGFNYERENA